MSYTALWVRATSGECQRIILKDSQRWMSYYYPAHCGYARMKWEASMDPHGRPQVKRDSEKSDVWIVQLPLAFTGSQLCECIHIHSGNEGNSIVVVWGPDTLQMFALVFSGQLTFLSFWFILRTLLINKDGFVCDNQIILHVHVWTVCVCALCRSSTRMICFCHRISFGSRMYDEPTLIYSHANRRWV